MEFIRTIKEKSQTKKQEAIAKLAESLITIQDFDNSLFIAYNGTPLAPIEPSWTTKEIVQQLSIFRSNFVNSRLKEEGLPRIAAIL
jgi:hypothetical protein